MECLRPALKKRKRYSPDDPEGVVGGFTTPVTPAGAPSDAGDSVPGITPKSVTFKRGSKCQRIVGSADPKIDRTPIDLPCHCDGCGYLRRRQVERREELGARWLRVRI